VKPRAWLALLGLAMFLWLLSGCEKVEVRKAIPVPKDPPPAEEGKTRWPFQEERWDSAEIRSIDVVRLDKAAALYEREKARYLAIEKPTGVPSAVVFVLHGRESTWDFSRHLHEGSPLTGRTKNVPKGRPKTGTPPFTFEESALDALQYDGMGGKNWLSLGDGLQAIEAFNGLGYQKYHPDVPSPYLWAGTGLYTSGKYVADGKWSASAVDKQLGAAAILKWMTQKGIKVWPVVTIETDMRGKPVAFFWVRGSVEF
jgi:lysozyme family protein